MATENDKLEQMAAGVLARKRAEGGQASALNDALAAHSPVSGTSAEPQPPHVEVPESTPVAAPTYQGDIKPTKHPVSAGSEEYEAVPQPLSPEEVARRMAEQAPMEPTTRVQWPGAVMKDPEPADRMPLDQFVAAAPQAATTPVDDDDAVIVTGNAGNAQGSPAPAEQFDEETIIFGEAAVKAVSELPKDAKDAFFAALKPEVQSYERELVTKYGYTPAEALEASKANAGKRATEYATKWFEDHPDGAIVTIDKSQEGDLKFTEEEQAKIQHAKAIKLIVVESAELETLTVEKPKNIIPMSRYREISSSLSNYSVPLISFGDYMSFRGAQSHILAMTTSDPDESMVAIMEKKAELLYNHYLGGQVLPKYNEKGEPITYDEFCNLYHYDDLDIGVYAVTTASAMEVTDSTFQCQNPNCRRGFNISYNQKALLDLSELNDQFKARVEAIDANRAYKEKLEELHGQYNKRIRLKSPVTKNVYEIANPTISEARKVMSACYATADVVGELYDMVICTYLSGIWVWDPTINDYLYTDVYEEPEKAFAIVCSIHDVDIELLTYYIRENKYAVGFKLKTNCPFCKEERENHLNVNNMLFLYARGSSTGIKL